MAPLLYFVLVSNQQAHTKATQQRKRAETKFSVLAFSSFHADSMKDTSQGGWIGE